MYKLILLITLLATVAGCAPFAPEARQEAPLPMPEEYTLYSQGDSLTGPWWQSFDSREIDGLVDEALNGNFDLKIALARLKQSRAQLTQTGAALMPSLSLDGSGRQQNTRSEDSTGNSSNSETQTWQLGLAASYELDLWGKLRAKDNAQLYTFQATAEDLDAAAVTVVGEVIDAWVDILATRRKLAIAREQMRINTTLLELLELRFANGKSDALAVSQQRQALAASKAEIPPLELQEKQLMNSLALLLGRANSGDLVIAGNELPELLPLPKAGLPSDLLAARPDIRSAGLELTSADWTVAAAQADRLPSLTLTATAAFSSGALDTLFSNWFTSLAGSLTGPIFDGNRRKAEVERTRAVAEQRLHEYAQAVAKAIIEVENNLVAEARQQHYLELLEEQLAAAEVTLADAGLQYRNGQSDYLSYISAWDTVQSLQRNLVTQQATLIKYRVALHRSLGGAWTGSLLEEPKQRIIDNDLTTGAEAGQGEV